MANCSKITRAGCNNLFNHYERKEGIKFGNQEIDVSKSYMNYNLAPNRNLSQNEILNKRLSEVKVLKREDVNVMCSWVITLPKTIEKESEEERKFFEKSYEFLKNEYGEENVISSYVHKDETTPHMHFAFIPIVIDKKKNIEKVSAKELITRNHLKVFHNNLSNYLNNYFKRDIGILNGATVNGNKTILELKNDELRNEINKTIKKLENYKLTLEEIDNLKIKNIPLIKGVSGINVDELKGILKVAIKGLKMEEKYNTLIEMYKQIERERDNLICENEKNKINLKNRIKEKEIFFKLKNEWEYQKSVLEQVPDEIINKIKEKDIIKNQKSNDLSFER